MPKYKCKNKECKLFNIELIRDTILKFVDSKMVDTGSVCPECKQECESIKEDGYCVTIHSDNIPN